MDRLVVANNQNGLCNRLKAIISAIRSGKDYKVIWLQANYLVKCNFNDLFKNKITIVKKYKPDNSVTISGWRFVLYPFDEHAHNVDFMFDGTPSGIKKSIVKAVEILEPQDYILNAIDEYKENLSGDVVTISLRTWQETLSHRKPRIVTMENVYKIIKPLNEKTKIFVTCDKFDPIEKLIRVFPKREVIYYPKKEYDITSEGNKAAIIELYLGGLTKKIYASYMSTFSELQWWFGGAKQEIEVFNYFKEKTK